ncbi:Pol protein, partial [Globisporangium splendens]
MGLAGMPGIWSRLMRVLFDKFEFVVVYLDDICVFSKTREEHVAHLRQAFGVLECEELYAHRAKCSFGKTSVDFLGHTVSSSGLSVDKRKTAAIEAYPEPTSRKELQSFLGLAGYYRRFICDFALHALPLSMLVKKNTTWQWTEKQRRAFQALKLALQQAPVLKLPDFAEKFTVTTDAAGYCMGGVLSQTVNGEDHPIAFYSKKFGSHEKSWPAHEKELCAIRTALDKWRHYLHGRPFDVFTDNSACRWMLHHPNVSPKMARSNNVVADALSRPNPSSESADSSLSAVRHCDEKCANMSLRLRRHSFHSSVLRTLPVQDQAIILDAVDIAGEVPCKDMILDGMVGSTVFSAIDLKDGFYQIRMRESDVPFTAVSTPSGMLREWMAMPQGLKNAPATFNRMVTNVLRPLREFAPSYFDDIFVHSKALGKKKDVDVHLEHLRQVFQVMRENKLYANLKKCIFFAPEIPVLGCFVGKNGVRADPEKVKAIDDWPIPQNVKQLRQWLGLANYLHKYTRNYAALVQPLTSLLKKDNEWEWSEEHQAAFAEVKKSLREAPVLALADHEKPFHVVCDASDYAIGCVLMQHDDEGKERVVSYQSRQLRSAERNYPVHDKELLAMKYALAKFRVYLLGEEQFAIYTDHPGKSNILADALSRRPDYDPKNKSGDTNGACQLCEDVNAIDAGVTSTIQEEITEGYKQDEACQELIKYFKNPSDKALQNLPSRARSRVHRYSMHNELLYYAVDEGDPARIVVPNDEGLRHRLLYEYHDGPSSGHLGREETFLNLPRDYYWPHMYKWVRKYVRTCEVCQRVKPSGSTQAPLRSLPVPQDSWKSVSMDFIFGLPRDKHRRNGVLVFVDRFSKMVHLTPVSDKISAEMTAKVFVDVVFRLHGLSSEIVSDRDTRFTSRFWRTLLGILDTKLSMSTAAHPETDGQTERVNRVLEDVLRSYATSFGEWSEFLPLAEFALNNSTHVSTGHTPFYANYGLHPRVPASLVGEVSTLSGGGTMAKEPQSDLNAVTELKANFDSMKPLDDMTSREEQQVDDFIVRRQAVVRFVRDAIAKAQDLQKEQADKSGRKNKQVV